MPTFLTLQKAAMRMTNAIESGESPDPDEQTDGLAIANRMLDSWNAERLMCYAIQRTTHTLVASTNPQTIGSGGNINTDRPESIENAGLIVSGEDFEYPVKVLHSMAEYAEIVDKETEDAIPRKLFYELGISLGKIYLYPVPSAANTLVLYRWLPLSSIATVGTTVTFAPGYEEAFVSNLAIRLAAEGMGVARAEILKVATDSLARIKTRNVKMPVLTSNYSGGNYGRSNIYTNE